MYHWYRNFQKNFNSDYLLHFFTEFIAHLDQTHGMLTLHSSLKDLVKYTQAGLDYLAKERDSLSRARRH